MILASHIEEVNGSTFVLGAIKPWSERVSRNPRPPRYIRLRSARIGKAKGVYAVPERIAKTEVHSLAALLIKACSDDRIDNRASLSNALVLVQVSSDQVWYALIKDGELQAGSDILHATSTESDREMWRNRLAEAKQLVPEECVFMFENAAQLVNELAASTGGDLGVDLLQAAKLSGASGSNLKRQLLLGATSIAIVVSAIVLYQNLQPTRTDESLTRQAEARALFSSAVSNYQRTIPGDQGRAYLQSALNVPINKFGADLASISCDFSHCQMLYSTDHARLVSPVINWARSIDPLATFDPASGVLSLKIDNLVTPVSREIPHAEPQHVLIEWADFRAALKPLGGITVSASNPAPVPGALELGESLKTGSWEVADVPFKYALAVIEGIRRMPGTGISYLRLSGESLTLGGTYAIQ